MSRVASLACPGTRARHRGEGDHSRSSAISAAAATHPPSPRRRRLRHRSARRGNLGPGARRRARQRPRRTYRGHVGAGVALRRSRRRLDGTRRHRRRTDHPLRRGRHHRRRHQLDPRRLDDCRTRHVPVRHIERAMPASGHGPQRRGRRPGIAAEPGRHRAEPAVLAGGAAHRRDHQLLPDLQHGHDDRRPAAVGVRGDAQHRMDARPPRRDRPRLRCRRPLRPPAMRRPELHGRPLAGRLDGVDDRADLHGKRRRAYDGWYRVVAYNVYGSAGSATVEPDDPGRPR